ncbi:MAG: transporter substrate-binding domain-containing protein [Bacillota bacterium]
MKKLILVLICLSLIFAYTACGSEEAAAKADTGKPAEAAAPTPEKTETADEVITLVTGEWAPFTSESMEGKGFFTEIVTAVLDEMGVKYEYVFYPWERCEKAVESGSAWAAFPYKYTTERGQKYLFSNNLAFSYNKFFYLKSNPKSSSFKYNTLEDLKDYRIGGVNGFFYKEAFEAAKLKVDWVSSEEDALNMLIKGRIDILPLSELAGWELIKKTYPEEIDNIGVIETPLDADNADLNLIVSKAYPNSQELLGRFNKAFEAIKANGKYDAIVGKYILK